MHSRTHKSVVLYCIVGNLVCETPNIISVINPQYYTTGRRKENDGQNWERFSTGFKTHLPESCDKNLDLLYFKVTHMPTGY